MVAGAGIRRTVHTKGVINTRTQPPDKYVPEVKGFIDVRVEFDDLERLRALQADYPQLIREVRGRGLLAGLEFYEEDVQTALGAAMALIEPMILIVMAVFVGGILISLYLPIFTLGAGVH